MNKPAITVVSVLIIIVFIGYIIFDVSRPESSDQNDTASTEVKIPDAWAITNEISVTDGKLKAVAAGPLGMFYAGGDSYVSCYDKELKLVWNVKTDSPVSALAISGDSIFASTRNQVLVLNMTGKIMNEWGPFEDKTFITSISANHNSVAFADAVNKMVVVLDKGGEVKKIIGQGNTEFIIPSPYFDLALDNENNLFTANTGHHRIETRTINGDIKSYFGEPGTAPGMFSGCCSPAHFALMPEGYVTAEKGMNRIKILNKKGEFVEFVSSKNTFIRSIPLDVATYDGKTIYAAYPGDSKIYLFNRK